MIEDAELRSLFQAESEEHLQSLEMGLLHLEVEPQDAASLETVFRAAHSLKGSSRMLGVSGLEALAHHFEDELGAARHGRTLLSAAVVERLYHGLDAMRQLAREAVTGETAVTDLAQALARLRGEAPPGLTALAAPSPLIPSDSQGPSYSADFGHGSPVTAAQLPGNGGSASLLLTTTPLDSGDLASRPELFREAVAPDDSSNTVPSSEFKIETIRVEPHRLDALMTRVGELAVTATRVRRGLAAVDDLATLWEEWTREAALRLNEREHQRLTQLGGLLGRLQRAAAEDMSWLDIVAVELEAAVRGMRLMPLATIFNLFPRLVRDLAHEQAKEIRLVIEGGETTADKRLLEELKDPLMHMIRNAVDHGIELPEARERQGKARLATLTLRAYSTATHVIIEVADDGHGLDPEAIRRTAQQRRLVEAESLDAMRPEQLYRLIFAPGFSTSAMITDVSGRGVGLDVVRENVERLKGDIQVESLPGVGSTFRIRTRITLATTHVLLVKAGAPGGQWSYALPVEFVQETLLVAPQDIFTIEGRPATMIDGQSVSVARLADLLELPAGPPEKPGTKGRAAPTGDPTPFVLLSVEQERFGVFVDELLDEQEVMLKPLGGLLQRVRNVSGATILGTGEICMILNPTDLLKAIRKARPAAELAPRAPEAPPRKLVLLAEDSLTTRTQERRILEGAGYEVVTAVDGADALSKLATRPFDALVSDIQMPNMDGLTLAKRIRQDPKYGEMPIILVTSLATDEDRRRGVEVGANAYITKGTFEQKVLLETLGRLV